MFQSFLQPAIPGANHSRSTFQNSLIFDTFIGCTLWLHIFFRVDGTRPTARRTTLAKPAECLIIPSQKMAKPAFSWQIATK
ncbi:MAG: hypothetical protein DA446_07450 [Bacteroidetes bacterium]|nr:MAG: hypothetical protein DA443_10100 [Bacteroidota bacterium]PTM19627.1 MAG: hypothetical protein DA446_07450 [Bacteroidota bacterium]